MDMNQNRKKKIRLREETKTKHSLRKLLQILLLLNGINILFLFFRQRQASNQW